MNANDNDKDKIKDKEKDKERDKNKEKEKGYLGMLRTRKVMTMRAIILARCSSLFPDWLRP